MAPKEHPNRKAGKVADPMCPALKVWLSPGHPVGRAARPVRLAQLLPMEVPLARPVTKMGSVEVVGAVRHAGARALRGPVAALKVATQVQPTLRFYAKSRNMGCELGAAICFSGLRCESAV